MSTSSKNSIKVIPKYYTVKVVQAKASDIAVDEVFSDNGNTYRVVGAEHDLVDDAGEFVLFNVMNLDTGAMEELYFSPDAELPVHVKIQRV